MILLNLFTLIFASSMLSTTFVKYEYKYKYTKGDSRLSFFQSKKGESMYGKDLIRKIITKVEEMKDLYSYIDNSQWEKQQPLKVDWEMCKLTPCQGINIWKNCHMNHVYKRLDYTIKINEPVICFGQTLERTISKRSSEEIEKEFSTELSAGISKAVSGSLNIKSSEKLKSESSKSNETKVTLKKGEGFLNAEIIFFWDITFKPQLECARWDDSRYFVKDHYETPDYMIRKIEDFAYIESTIDDATRLSIFEGEAKTNSLIKSDIKVINKLDDEL